MMDRILAEQRRAAEYVLQNPNGPEVRGAALGVADWVGEEVLEMFDNMPLTAARALHEALRASL